MAEFYFILSSFSLSVTREAWDRQCVCAGRVSCYLTFSCVEEFLTSVVKRVSANRRCPGLANHVSLCLRCNPVSKLEDSVSFWTRQSLGRLL